MALHMRMEIENPLFSVQSIVPFENPIRRSKGILLQIKIHFPIRKDFILFPNLCRNLIATFKFTILLALNIVLVCGRFNGMSDYFEKKASKSFISYGSVGCVLRFYETHMDTSDASPGTVITANLMINSRSEFESHFLKHISDGRRNFYNSALLIRKAGSKSFSSDNAIPKTAKYILFVSRAREVEENILSWKNTSSWNPLAPVFIVFRNWVSSPQSKVIEVKRAFSVLRSHDMWRVFAVLTESDKGMTRVLSWFPFEASACGNSSNNIKVLDWCYFNPKNRFDADNLSPIDSKAVASQVEWKQKWRLETLNRCPFRIVAHFFPSHVMRANSFSSDETLWGIEIYLVGVIASTLNMSLQVHTVNYTRYRSIGKFSNIVEVIEKG